MTINQFPLENVTAHIVVAIGIFDDQSPNQFHAGLIFDPYLDSSPPKYLHFFFNEILLTPIRRTNFFWWCLPSSIPPETQALIAASCELIYDQHRSKKCVFNFGSYREAFGEGLNLTEECLVRTGLTCTSFLLAIFAYHGADIVDLDDWPVTPEDISWQSRMSGDSSWSTDQARPRHRPEHLAALVQSERSPARYSDIAEASSGYRMAIGEKYIQSRLSNFVPILKDIAEWIFNRFARLPDEVCFEDQKSISYNDLSGTSKISFTEKDMETASINAEIRSDSELISTSTLNEVLSSKFGLKG